MSLLSPSNGTVTTTTTTGTTAAANSVLPLLQVPGPSPAVPTTVPIIGVSGTQFSAPLPSQPPIVHPAPLGTQPAQHTPPTILVD